METYVLGPAMLAIGFGFIHFSLKGMPVPFPRRQKAAAPAKFGAEDRLLGDVLCEMLTLHSELDSLRSQLAQARQAKQPRRKAATAS
jgi:hypothetical protein